MVILGFSVSFQVIWESMHRKCKRTPILRKLCSYIKLHPQIYQKINIRIVLSELEVWTDKDKVPFNKNAGPDLENFNKYKQTNIGSAHDCVHLMRFAAKTDQLSITK